MSTNKKPTATAPGSEADRRKLVAAYRRLAQGRRFTPAERAEFARMASAWERTLTPKN